ncbi:ceramide glucosyltransferase [Lichenihabitans psoromatis]|uniref:ceramide glucosyltransferase n=1 Tax=Lichenihabitans psoromatis TaxID=2528642 RepID=UPI001036A05A|nr:ceramide glucosyltransferase [Lichenihabitans psoromatis]
MTVAQCAAGFCFIMTTVQVVSTTIARYRCPERKTPLAAPADAPPVSIVRPVCGLENYAEETLGSSFHLDYPDYEVLFCAARADDPVLPLLKRLIDANPGVPARILIGDDWINANPKLNNVAKGWHAAAHDWIVMADSNVLMPGDYLQRLLAAWRPDTGLVCSTPIGSHPDGFWADVECGFLNSLQARWQYAAEAIGLGFAQGKTMLWRRDILESAGGITALGAEIAEDAAATKLVRRKGLRVRLVDSPFEQPLGRRKLSEVWARQTRWARLRRVTFPMFFLPEILSGSLLSLLAGAYAAWANGYDPILAGLLVWVIWLAAEVQLALSAGWRFTWTSPFAWMIRDLMLPLIFVSALAADDFVWRGNEMDVKESKQT